MNTLRFVATSKKNNKIQKYIRAGFSDSPNDHVLHMEALSVHVIEEICKQHDVAFELCDIERFIEIQSNGADITLSFEPSIEPLLYTLASLHKPPIIVDGMEIDKFIRDKYSVYRRLSSIEGLHQPFTMPLSTRHDLEGALSSVVSKKIVIKPRFHTFESRNVLIIDKKRIMNLKPDECLNFVDCIMQEYPSECIWPPREWRFHFVGRDICRCMKTIDKNNWSRALKIEEVRWEDVVPSLQTLALKVAKCLVGEKNNDNFTLDFLETNSGFLFLEANCGNLGSFFISNPEEKKFIEPIFRTLFQRYFGIQ